MRSYCYPTVVSEQLLRHRYKKVGGIARVLLTSPLDARNHDIALRTAITNQTSALHDIAENPIRIDGGEV